MYATPSRTDPEGSRGDSSERRTALTVRFSHVDPAGIVYYPRYLEWFSREAPDQYLDSFPYKIEIDYLRPSRLGDQLQVLTDCRKSSVKMHIHCDGELRFQACLKTGEFSSDLLSPPHAEAFVRSRPVDSWACGPTGHLHLSRYVEMLNTQVEEWFTSGLKYDFASMHLKDRLLIPTRALDLRVLELPRLDQTIELCMDVVKSGGRSLVLRTQASHQGRLLLASHHVLVWARYRNAVIRPVTPPTELTEKIRKFVVKAD